MQSSSPRHDRSEGSPAQRGFLPCLRPMDLGGVDFGVTPLRLAPLQDSTAQAGKRRKRAGQERGARARLCLELRLALADPGTAREEPRTGEQVIPPGRGGHPPPPSSSSSPRLPLHKRRRRRRDQESCQAAAPAAPGARTCQKRPEPGKRPDPAPEHGGRARRRLSRRCCRRLERLEGQPASLAAAWPAGSPPSGRNTASVSNPTKMSSLLALPRPDASAFSSHVQPACRLLLSWVVGTPPAGSSSPRTFPSRPLAGKQNDRICLPPVDSHTLPRADLGLLLSRQAYDCTEIRGILFFGGGRGAVSVPLLQFSEFFNMEYPFPCFVLRKLNAGSALQEEYSRSLQVEELPINLLLSVLQIRERGGRERRDSSSLLRAGFTSRRVNTKLGSAGFCGLQWNTKARFFWLRCKNVAGRLPAWSGLRLFFLSGFEKGEGKGPQEEVRRRLCGQSSSHLLLQVLPPF